MNTPAAAHEGHETVQMPLRHLRAVHIYCRTCRVTSPGKVRDMTSTEYDKSDPQAMSSSRFD